MGHGETWPSAEMGQVDASRSTQESRFTWFVRDQAGWARSLFGPSFQGVSVFCGNGIFITYFQGRFTLITSKCFRIILKCFLCASSPGCCSLRDCVVVLFGGRILGGWNQLFRVLYGNKNSNALKHIDNSCDLKNLHIKNILVLLEYMKIWC